MIEWSHEARMTGSERVLRRHQILFTLLVILLVGLLGGLALLQYRWIDKVSAAEADRMHLNLETSARQLRTDLNGQLYMLRFAVAMDGYAINSGQYDHFSQQFDVFRTQSPFPGLVRDVFLYRSNRTTLRYSVHDHTFAPVNSSELPEPVTRIETEVPEDEFGPKIVSYALSHPYELMVVPVESHQRQGDREMRSYIVISINTSYLLNTVLPALVKAHLDGASGGPGSSEYNVYVVDRFAESVRYPTDSHTSLPISGDLSIPLFFSPQSGDSAGWDLVIQHVRGSLNRMVAATRNRNLAISSGILVLLLASLAVLLVLFRRDRQLTRKEREFIAAVTHELRTPLTVVQSAAENLGEGLVTEHDQIRRYGETILGEGRRLSAMVERILLYSGIQSGSFVTHREQLSLSRIVRQVVDRYRDDAERSGVDVLEVISDQLPSVWGDTEALRSVAENLISNAIKHSGRDTRIEVRLLLRRGDVVLEVRDNGPGIPRSELRRIFEPFYRGSRARSNQVPGSGLGLSLVRSIVEAHGGAISVTSEAGGGTQFSVSLPADAG